MKAVWWILGIGTVCGVAIGGALLIRRFRQPPLAGEAARLSPSLVASGPNGALAWQTGVSATRPGAAVGGGAGSYRVLGWRPSLANATHASVLTATGAVELRAIAGDPTLERLLAAARKPLSANIMDYWRGR